jgi:PAS domain S-box-containing protein
MSVQPKVGLSFLFDTAYRYQSDFQRYVSNYTQFLKHENPHMDEAQMTMAQQTLKVEFYRLCLESLGLASFDGLLVLDYEGVLLEINAMAEKTLGFNRDKVLGKPCFQSLFPGNHREDYLDWIKSNAPQPDSFRKSTEVLMVKENGTIFPAELKVTELNIFGSALLVMCFNDVTRRKWMDQALKYTEERYRKIMGENADAICLVDPYNKRIEESNTSFNIMLGYSDDELFALRLYDVLEGEPENIDAWIEKSLQQGTSFLSREQGRFKSRHGHFVDVEYSCSIFDLRDHPILCIIARDTAPREYTVRHALVDDQITAMDKKLQKLEERIRELGQTRLSRVQQEILDEMSEFQQALQTDLIPTAKNDKGLDLSPAQQAFEIKALLYQVQSFFDEALQAKGVSMELSIADDVPDVMIGDPLKMQEVLYHLLENAVSHTRDGNVLVNVRLKDAHKTDAQILFTVRDSGAGIPKVTKAKVSDVISDSDPLRVGKKYGVRGIAIAARYVQYLKGEVRFNTVEGKGTSFVITLPLSMTQQAPEDLPELSLERLKKHLALVSHEEVASDDLLADFEAQPAEEEAPVAAPPPTEPTFTLVEDDTPPSAAPEAVSSPSVADHPAELIPEPVPVAPAVLDMHTALRLLLVESDVDNALTLQQLTAGQTIEMRMVDNGRKAIELVEEQNFDLILMSLQAPVMSGQAAAAAIRLAEQSNRTRPVFLVALDSEGTYDDGEDALRDFDALVTAPLLKEAVDEVMLQARARAQNISLAETPTAAPVAAPVTAAAVGIPDDILSALTPSVPSTPAPVAPVSQARTHIAVHISSDMAGLAPDFLNKRRQDVDKLQRALDEQKFDSVRVLGKSMKGTGAIYGFEQIAELGKSLEQAAVDESTATIQSLTLELEDFLERVELVID